MKKYLLLAVAIVLIAAAGRVYWASQQVNPDGQKAISPVVVLQNTNLTPITTTTVVVQEEGEMIGGGGNNAGPDCQYKANTDVGACRGLSIEYKIELSDSIKNSSYIVGADSKHYSTGWNNSYFISQPVLGVRFLGTGQSLISREVYNKIFLKNVIDDKNFVYNFSVHCSDDKTILPTVDSRQCSWSDNPESEYLFNDKGERITTLADFKKNLISEYNGYPDDVSSLETVKKLKINTALVFDQGHVYIPVTNALEKVEVIYSGYIDGNNKLIPNKKLEEISYFKDGSTTTIK